MTQQPNATPEMLCPSHGRRARPALGRILVIVDPTVEVHPCIDKAARIAIACGSVVELYVCDTVLLADAEPRLSRLRDMLEKLASPLRSRGLDVTVRCERGVPLEHAVGLHVIRTHPDLVVKDTHRHAAMRGVVALTDWILIRQIAPPLLLVKPAPWQDRMRITVSADPCHPAERPVSLDQSMLAIGDLLESAMNANLDVFHVLRPPPHLPGVAVPEADTHRAHAAARLAVERLIEERYECDGPPLIRFAEGRVASSILEFVTRNGPDILIMGASARPRWAHTAASGTVAQVLEEVKCDLLILKPPGFVSPLLVTDE